MIDQKVVHQDFGPAEDGFAVNEPAFSFLLAAGGHASAILTRAREDAAIEAQDVLSQADEALVMG